MFVYSDGDRKRDSQARSWVDDLELVPVVEIGTAAPGVSGLVLASFNAG